MFVHRLPALVGSVVALACAPTNQVTRSDTASAPNVGATAGAAAPAEPPAVEVHDSMYTALASADWVVVRVPYAYTNRTADTVGITECLEGLQRWTAVGWRMAWSPTCVAAAISPRPVAPGEHLSGTVTARWPLSPTMHWAVASPSEVAGVYRVLLHVEAHVWQPGTPAAPLLPMAGRTSAPFRAEVRPR